jgi:hypothetical protein
MLKLTYITYNFKLADIGTLDTAVGDYRGFNLARPIDFEKLLLDSVDEALLLLGESARQSIYFHFEKEFNLSREEIPIRLEEFQCAIERLFGIGSRYIEILVMKNLHKKIGLPVRTDQSVQFEFVKYVDNVRCSYSPETCKKESL